VTLSDERTLAAQVRFRSAIAKNTSRLGRLKSETRRGDQRGLILAVEGSVLLLSNRAFDFRAAALADVSDLNQAIAELDCLALLRPHRFVFFRRHSTPTAWTDHNWLFRARPHG